MMAVIVRVIVNAFALWVATLVPGIELNGTDTARKIVTLIVVAVIFGIINAIIKPIIKVLGCGLYILTLGLISFVVNALLFMLLGWVAGKLSLPFEVTGFWPAFWGAIIVAIVSFGINLVLPDKVKRD